MNPYVTGQTIQMLREKRRMTQKQLADLLYISDKTVSKWETGVSHSKRYHTKYDEPTLIHYQL